MSKCSSSSRCSRHPRTRILGEFAALPQRAAFERDKGGRPPASLELPSERTCQEEILFRFLLASQEQCPLNENV